MKLTTLWLPLLACLMLGTPLGCSLADDGTPITCTGDYWVNASDTAGDLAVIANCREITGDLGFDWTELSDLDGLPNLTAVGGDLYIGDNVALTNVDGLSGLTSVGGYLHIYFNAAITNVDGLSNLTSVGGSLSITDNPLLCQSSVDALIEACTVGTWLSTYGNLNGC